MLLAIDIGNTHTVFGVFQGKDLKADWRVSSTAQKTEDEVGALLLQFLRGGGIDKSSIQSIGISSVVPNLTDIFNRMAEKYFGHSPVIIGSHLDLGFTIRYKDPSAVGADRLCNAVAGFAKYGGPLIIVDFGTATTYDVIAANGDYLGGVIAAGVETSAADLHRRAARLPKIELHLPKQLIATDTVASMQAGILYGAIDSLEGMIRRLQKEIHTQEGKEARVIATGGFSTFISSHTHVLSATEPTLVLDGVRLIVDRLPRAG
ncbi:MAG: type III pantothenate kinase [Bacteroidota bacterium]